MQLHVGALVVFSKRYTRSLKRRTCDVFLKFQREEKFVRRGEVVVETKTTLSFATLSRMFFILFNGVPVRLCELVLYAEQKKASEKRGGMLTTFDSGKPRSN